MKKYIVIILILLSFIIGIFVDQLYTSINMEDMFYLKKEYNLPKTVFMEKQSPDSLDIVQILYEEKSNSYFLAFKKAEGSKMIIVEDLVKTGGYHNPIFKITWNQDNESFNIVIDHDFGEGNKEYIFDCRELKLIEKQNTL